MTKLRHPFLQLSQDLAHAILAPVVHANNLPFRHTASKPFQHFHMVKHDAFNRRLLLSLNTPSS